MQVSFPRRAGKLATTRAAVGSTRTRPPDQRPRHHPRRPSGGVRHGSGPALDQHHRVTQRGRLRLREAGPGRTIVTFRLAYHSDGGLLGVIADRIAAGRVGRPLSQSLKTFSALWIHRAALRQRVRPVGLSVACRGQGGGLTVRCTSFTWLVFTACASSQPRASYPNGSSPPLLLGQRAGPCRVARRAV